MQDSFESCCNPPPFLKPQAAASLAVERDVRGPILCKSSAKDQGLICSLQQGAYGLILSVIFGRKPAEDDEK